MAPASPGAALLGLVAADPAVSAIESPVPLAILLAVDPTFAYDKVNAIPSSTSCSIRFPGPTPLSWTGENLGSR
jgi:hypothetical protein